LFLFIVSIIFNLAFMEMLSSLSEHTFYEFAIILFLAALLGGVGQMLRQPLIVMFIALGVVVGPALLDIVKSKDNIDLLADMGITILLFVVGLKLDLRIIKSVGRIALLTGLGQVIFTSLFGFLIGLWMGFPLVHSFYIAVALTFSSTIIIVKLLSDKREIDSLHGQIAIGFLIVQDIVVILVMIVLSTMGNIEERSLTFEIIKTVLSGALLFAITIAMMKWVLPRLSSFLANSTELLTLFAIAWCVVLASVASLIGFSSEVGAFMAGVSLASSQFKDVISGRLVSIRDFLLLFFFVDLGSNLNLDVIGSQVTPAIIFSAFVLIGNPIIVLIIMGIMGYRKRTSFLAGLTVAQISEFSLIFAGLGLAIGHITEQTVGLITLVGLITIGLSTYMILYSHRIYEFIAPALRIFERKNPYNDISFHSFTQEKADVIILGLGRFGEKITNILDTYKDTSYLGVDYDPSTIELLRAKGKNVFYGDLEDPEMLNYIPYQDSKCIISTVPNREQSMQLIRTLRQNNYMGRIFLTSLNKKDYHLLKTCGADKVLVPQRMAAQKFYEDYLKGNIIPDDQEADSEDQ
jgi:Kef-type K+ transport system membrane component KefB